MLIEQHDGDFVPIRDDAMSLLIAGHETSGALLSWLFLALVEHPDWRARVIAEVAEQTVGRVVTVADLPELPILRAAVAEVLRLRPPAYTLFLRQATESVHLDGDTIAPDDLVQVVPYTVHRDPRWFPEPERFDPGRFLVEPTWPDYAYLPSERARECASARTSRWSRPPSSRQPCSSGGNRSRSRTVPRPSRGSRFDRVAACR